MRNNCESFTLSVRISSVILNPVTYLLAMKQRSTSIRSGLVHSRGNYLAMQSIEELPWLEICM